MQYDVSRMQQLPRYGMVKPGGAKLAVAAKPSLFAGDDDEEDDFRSRLSKAQANAPPIPAAYAPQPQDDDEAVYDYDNWKETEEQQKAQSRAASKAQQQDAPQSRYIEQLLEKAKERQFEREKMLDRKIAKENAAEEALYGDTEAFVTGAYAAKLEERKAKEAALRKQDAQDDANDVTRKKDFTGFYRNLLMKDGVAGGGGASTRPGTGTGPVGPGLAGAHRTANNGSTGAAAGSLAAPQALKRARVDSDTDAGLAHPDGAHKAERAQEGRAAQEGSSTKGAADASVPKGDTPPAMDRKGKAERRPPFRSSEADLAAAKERAEARWAARRASAGSGRKVMHVL